MRKKNPKPNKVTKHVHPRSLGRAIARNLMKKEDIPQMNKHRTKFGQYKPSVFSVYWREILFLQPTRIGQKYLHPEKRVKNHG